MIQMPWALHLSWVHCWWALHTYVCWVRSSDCSFFLEIIAVRVCRLAASWVCCQSIRSTMLPLQHQDREVLSIKVSFLRKFLTMRRIMPWVHIAIAAGWAGPVIGDFFKHMCSIKMVNLNTSGINAIFAETNNQTTRSWNLKLYFSALWHILLLHAGVRKSLL